MFNKYELFGFSFKYSTRCLVLKVPNIVYGATSKTDSVNCNDLTIRLLNC